MIGINIIYNLKDQLTGGLHKIKEAFSPVDRHIKSLQLSTANLFAEMRAQIPFLDSFVGLLKNPYVLAAGGVAALTAGVIGLGSHLFDVSAEIQKNQQSVKAIFGLTGLEMENITSKSIALSKTFDLESKDIIIAGNALQKAYADAGLTAGESLNLIQQGLQATNGLLDLEQIKEYPTQLKAIGLSAEQTIALMSQGIKQGVFNDKAPDTLKEIGLRIREMPQAAKDALAKLGMDSAKITKDLNSGAKSQFQVIQEIANKVTNIKDVQAYQEAVSNVFGGPGEDAGKEFLKFIAQSKLEMKGLIDLQDPFIKSQNQRIALEEKIIDKQQEFAPAFNQLKGDFDNLILKGQLLFYEIIAGAVQIFQNLGITGTGFFQALSLGIDYLQKAFTSWLPYIEIGVHFLSNLVTTALWLIDTMSPLIQLFLLFKGIMLAINIIMAANPLGALITGLVLVAVGLKTAYERSATFRAFLAGLIETAKALYTPMEALSRVIIGVMTFDAGRIRSGVKDSIKAFNELNVAGAFEKGYKSSLAADLAKQKKEAEEKAKNANADLGSKGAKSDSLTPGKPGGTANPTASPEKAADKVVSSAQQTRNITVNIEALMKDTKIHLKEVANSIGLSPQDFEKMMEETLLRIVRNVEAIA
jgi:hypothetical protein